MILPCASQDYFREDGLRLHRAQVSNGKTLRRAGREQRKHLLDSTNKEVDGGDSTLLVEYVLSGDSIMLYLTSPTTGELVSLQGTRTMLKNPEG